ncbi:MAG: ATP synthase F0 subunit A [Candidatus Colwellbacteria bacterium RIFCSPLOWO2_01_FULL_48_10]|uniref:ATP synthase subunit a n=2 Tax=Bacteria candidate phyla TaxID=1783234 RepID=A0A1F5P0J9_9BACT|nr:MAG: ATP synthase F0 subunit A [Candidatus Doudnabacteria bacterium RIFCSPHIGHO2_01_FULL_49_9]OGY60369.1 MAG: ATP synthase F0 subunit A [Candidatus Colwellbacteria bacterium RIFCSPLOWO2_01_FULL_48_10]
MINIPTVAAEKIFEIGGFHVTNTLLLSWIVIVFLGILALCIKLGFNAIPKGLQNLFEWMIEQLLNLTEGIFGSRKDAEKYLPFIATIFIFVLFSNWFGILPGVGSLGVYEEHNGHTILVPFFRSAGSDLNFTLALAVITVLGVNILGIVAIGFFKHFGKFISFKSPISFFVGILELISEVARMVSFSFRLFGNIFAGEVMLVIAAFFLPYVLPVPLLALEIFVGLIQAAVFAILASVFISIAVKEHH